MKTLSFILVVVCFSLSCSRPFDEIPKSHSGIVPKKYLIAPIVSPNSFLGTIARPIERSTPLVRGERIYVGSVHNQIVAIRKKSGTVLWRKKVPSGVESSPQYFNRRLYFGANNGLFYCVSAENGKTVWTYKTDTEILSNPVIKGGIVYFVTVKNELYALKADTGKWVWYHNRGYVQKISVRGSSSPVYHDGKIYVGFSDGFLFAFNAFNGTVVWQRRLARDDKFIDVDVTPVIGRGAIFAGTSDGYLYALGDKTGDTIWKKKYDGIHGMVADRTMLYIATLSGSVFAVKRSNGIKQWEFLLKQGVPGAPILVEDQLIFGSSEKYVYSVDIETGHEIWRYNSGSGVSSTPVFDDDRIYLFSEFSALHVIDPFYLLSEG